MDKMLNAKDMARVLSLCERTIWRLAKKGLLIPPVRIGKSCRWIEKDVVKWVKDGCPPVQPKQKRGTK